RALRPEGIKWPFRDDGKPTNRLELITKLNGVSHEHAHDALSDVYATIAVAKLIRDKQPKMFDYLLKLRDKRAVQRLVNLAQPQPFVYASGRYSNDYNKTTVAFPLTSGRNGNVLVYDLRYNLEKLVDGFSGTGVAPARRHGRSAPSSSVVTSGHPLEASTSVSQSYFPIVKELCYNKCPAVAPLGVLESGDGWKKIGLTKETVEENLKALLGHPEFAEQMRAQYENRPEFPPAIEPEAALYDGFLNDRDRIKVSAVRNAEPSKLADFHPEFDDERLPELLLHYKGRNYPESLSENELAKWEEYRKARLERLTPKFLAELEQFYHKDEYIGEELKLYFESLI
ncbi:exodeoxyribonuclease I, partial [Candidatus Saccharibacteria bacterium]|nr:exodeoxyribonuclease I [Candidatus Saccharibacteria bacterium]